MLPKCTSVTYHLIGRKALVVYIDKFSSWNKHNEVISKKNLIRHWAGQKPHFDHNPLICAYNTSVLPYFDYCCEFWDPINLALCNCLQK
mgnify:CR=1 FL=1